ncbi:MAG: 4Fe-4S dicluster domain-containing protein [Anaerolineae bacterium CFX3]|nr:Menaquinone reductase, iron-sulfur cluster-binding subunit [Anaerolineales bacterium]MCC7511382.1 4Fe-4S dicluster domain-containing protein [Anaerolineae bacterium]MCE7905440.1 4Fe-4S dicluster domain-containing protein [Anaerolineae bacterium CFX3]MBW7920383.1 4Fe-4S dicluster domain-containing protein [Anaerolineales bacterium]MCQ3945260.1 4Fe-4S ferredoxin [Anaerolineae bacterium]
MIDLNIVGAKGAIAEEAEGKWGMVIDQDLCTGCQACVAACAMENNIAFVGEEDSGYGRSMHWIRIERFWEGEYPNVKMTRYQPMMCQQCGHAPCEPVCPAFATVHSQSQQVNLQVYNRCVGTRYCANNCPYQVRSFNWRDYADERINAAIRTLKNQYNPDVTVRRRGIMEKCTFCIQRIHKAEDKAKSEGREVVDGEFTTACAQACPADAIVFGRIDNPESLVAQLTRQRDGVRHLEELGTLPRVTYFAGGQ